MKPEIMNLQQMRKELEECLEWLEKRHPIPAVPEPIYEPHYERKVRLRDFPSLIEFDGYSRDYPKCPSCGETLERFNEYPDDPNVLPRWSCPKCKKPVKVIEITYYKVEKE